MTAEWNGQRYHRVSEPQFQWGLKVLSELSLRGDETVLDAGCGSGRLTKELLHRLPRGRAIAFDASESMLNAARETLAPLSERVSFVQGDLLELSVEPVDVIFSTATFHWVLDHDALVKRLFAALKADGRLHAQCGGAGNLQRFLSRAQAVANREPFREFLGGFDYPTLFAPAEETAQRLLQAGFAEVKTWLTPAPTPFESRETFRDFISAVVLRHALAALPPALPERYLDEVVAACEGEYALDYVRLDWRARRPTA